MTPSDFAAMVGISEPALLDFEAGADRIDALLMMRLCKALHVSAKYFFEPWIGGGSSVSDTATSVQSAKSDRIGLRDLVAKFLRWVYI